MAERWQKRRRGTVVSWELPREVKRFGEYSKVGLALVGNRGSIGILMAHHDDSIAINFHLTMKLEVAILEFVHSCVKLVELFVVSLH